MGKKFVFYVILQKSSNQNISRN